MLSHAHVRSIIYSRNSERTNGRRCWREKRASELFDDEREGRKKKKKKKREEKKQREQDPKFSDVVESFERGNVIETLILPVPFSFFAVLGEDSPGYTTTNFTFNVHASNLN